MNIIEKKYTWNGTLAKRNSTRYIVVHHGAGDGDADSIHALHLTWGWTGFGYHFYVRKDGSVYRGRPLEMIGAHCEGYNSCSLGICFEGNFEIETMSEAQLKAGKGLIAYLKAIYPDAEVKGHRDLGSTACPGKKFPFEEIKKGKATKIMLETPNDIIWELSQMIEINETDRAVKALEQAKKENSSLYWILYKIVNK